jgi:uncharacterized membrane protein YgcG
MAFYTAAAVHNMFSHHIHAVSFQVLTMEYGPDFHGHERTLREERVFHNFDPEKAHTSQFLHPILRYYSPGVESRAAAHETAAHHVIEDIYTNFTNPIMHLRPMMAFLERFRRKPLDWADLPLKLGWAEVMRNKGSSGKSQAWDLHKAGGGTAGPISSSSRAYSSNSGSGSDSSDGGGSSSGGVGDAAAPPLEGMKARELRQLLKQKGLATGGSKAQLLSRLGKSEL